jgi:hypothetical protein
MQITLKKQAVILTEPKSAKTFPQVQGKMRPTNDYYGRQHGGQILRRIIEFDFFLRRKYFMPIAMQQ